MVSARLDYAARSALTARVFIVVGTSRLRPWRVNRAALSFVAAALENEPGVCA